MIGLTLRYDSIDNFWYTLLHELSHLGRHLGDCRCETAFVDDNSLRRLELRLKGKGNSLEIATQITGERDSLLTEAPEPSLDSLLVLPE